MPSFSKVRLSAYVYFSDGIFLSLDDFQALHEVTKKLTSYAGSSVCFFLGGSEIQKLEICNFDMGVSKNGGTPKWMVKIMENPLSSSG